MRLILAFACCLASSLCACGDDDYGTNHNLANDLSSVDQSVALDSSTD